MEGGDIMDMSYEQLLVEKQANERYDELAEWFKNFQDVEFDIPREFYIRVSSMVY